RPFAALVRWTGVAVRALAFGLAWVLVRMGRLLSLVVGRPMGAASRIAMAPYERAERGYLRLLPAALARPALVLGIAAAAFVASMAIVPTLGTDLIPQLAQDRFEMTMRLPPGTPLRETDAMMRRVQQAHADDDGVAVLFGVSGSGTRLDANPTDSGENVGRLSVVMDGGGSEALEARSEEHTSELQSRENIVCRLLLEQKKAL